ncbi:cryptochrome/photolyase family protein [Halothiobacillus sp. DCM-1]|uniref:cryptochrome/photolyase family protein n=1 Tax=Halothiobacillus sp. DCM-1 TaxID=3112558 RepID=UPI0032454DEC
MPHILWFRDDLRLADHPALHAALLADPSTGDENPAIIPVYIDDPAQPEGGAVRWWRHHSLAALDRALRAHDSRLILARGEPLTVLRGLIAASGATAVFWNRRLTPAGIATDQAIKTALQAEGLRVESFNGNYLYEPWTLKTTQDQPFQVFTPYYKAVLRSGLNLSPLPEPTHIPPPPDIPSLALADLRLLPTLPWAAGFTEWHPGETGAWQRLEAFLPRVEGYASGRDRLDGQGVSKLSAHLRFGEINPRQIIATLAAHFGDPLALAGSEHFVRELIWREFGAYLLYHFPHTLNQPLNPRFAHIPWRNAPDELLAWQRGQTGIPVVDAAMRCLWQTGWMHNRARMIVASFLTKNLLIDWRIGADWFMDTLVDADLASNTAGWQWTAGSGADAAPYFRVFNPVLQAEKFDPAGDFLRRWLPELAALPTAALIAPWQADPHTLRRAGITLGTTYPHPIVDLKGSRERALQMFAQLKTAHDYPYS